MNEARYLQALHRLQAAAWPAGTPREPRVWNGKYHVLSRLGSGSYGTALLVSCESEPDEKYVCAPCAAALSGRPSSYTHPRPAPHLARVGC